MNMPDLILISLTSGILPMIKKPIEWVKIHNLPDHVYFSHAQHVNAGKVQCQSCHGAINEMGEVKQVQI